MSCDSGDKVKFFDRVSKSGRWWLQEMLEEGGSAQSFEPAVIQAMWGDDIYNWIYDLKQ